MFGALICVFTFWMNGGLLGGISANASIQEFPFQLNPDLKLESSQLRWRAFESKSAEERSREIQLRADAIRDLLDPQSDTYKGEDSLPTECQFQNLPKAPDGHKLFSFYSSKSRVLGLCGRPENRLKTQYLVLDCKHESKVYFIQYFYQAERDWLLKPVAHCKAKS